MVFSCAHCQARYRIDDALVLGRAVRFACRRCGQAHLLRHPDEVGPANHVAALGTPNAPPPVPPTPSPATPPVADPGRPPPRGTATGPRSAESKGLADQLYGDLSTPSFDLRRAGEVQPDEPLWQPRSARLRTDPIPARSILPEDPPPPPTAFERPNVILAPAWPAPPQAAGLVGPGPQGSDVPPPDVAGSGGSAPGQAPDVQEFADLLQSWDRVARRRRNRRRVFWGLVTLSVVAVLGGGALALLDGPGPEPARIPATADRSEVPASAGRPGASATATGPDRSASHEPAAPASSRTPAVTPAPDTAPSAPTTVATQTAPAGAAAPRNGPDPVQAPPPLAMDVFLKAEHPRFLDCKSRMRSPPASTLMVRLDFGVDPTGAVDSVVVEALDGVRDMPLVNCIRNVAEGWRFPARASRDSYSRVLGL